jgi:redox-sensitive bicupin YhaK (pirin superfamily)
MIEIRKPDEIYQVKGEIQNGTFQGRWHFSFNRYRDERYLHFGTLRVLNDDTLSPGAIWPLHPHRNIEVVTYCAQGEFRHADEHGRGGILKKGWVQHTTVGRGMQHSEINNRQDIPMRFIQMWFFPLTIDLEPSVEQKKVETGERTNKILPLVAEDEPGALPIRSPARVSSCLLQGEWSVQHPARNGWGTYLYVLEGGPVLLNGKPVLPLGAAKCASEDRMVLKAKADAELLLVDVQLGKE